MYVRRWMTYHTSYGMVFFTAMIDEIATAPRMPRAQTPRTRSLTLSSEPASAVRPSPSFAA